MSLGAHKTDSNRLVRHGLFKLCDSNENILKKKSIFFTAWFKSKFQEAC